MKKLLAILMLFIYTLGVSGVGVVSHFCCGRLAALNIEYSFSSSLRTSGNSTEGCCKNVNHFYQVRDAHQQSASDIMKVPAARAPLIFFTFEKLVAFLQPPELASPKVLHAPPLLTDPTPLYIHFSIFRI